MADKTGYIGRNPGDSSVTIARQTFTPTSNTTEFTFTSGYTVGLCDVYLNGVKLVDTRDYEANTGSTVGLTSEAVSGDIVEIIAYKAFNLGQVSSASGNFDVNSSLSVGSTSTLSGVVTTGGDLYVGGVIYGDGSNLTGVAATDNINTNNIAISGIATVGTSITMRDGAINVTGVITATSFSGDGSALSGIGGTSDINTNNIQISGITTLGSIRGDIQIDGSAVGVTSVTWDASANSLIFKDESYAKFGDGSDLSIYHQNGSSLIANTTGQLLIRSSTGLQLGSIAGEVYVAGTENGAVDLYWDNSKKFNTDSAGSYTTGIHTASQSLHAGTTVQLDGGTGIVTATSYKGDGSALTGVGGEFDITSCLFI